MLRSMSSAMFILTTALALKWLWAFWTPRCNESCPGSIVIAIYLTFAAVAFITLCIATLTAWGKVGLKTAIYAYLTAAAITAICVAILTQVNA